MSPVAHALPRDPLVFLDERPESELGLAVAAALAPPGAARVSAIEVLEPLPPWSTDAVDPALLELDEFVRSGREARLHALASEWSARGLALATRLVSGIASLEVIREAVAGSHDLVIKVARGRPELGWPLFGSVAQHLVRKCPVPVWLAAPERPAAPRRVLAVVTPDAGGPAPAALDLRVLALAGAVATRCGAELDVLRPWSVGASRLLPARVARGEALRRLRDAAHEAFAKVLDAAGVDPRQALFLEGSIVEAVARHARATGVDLVVIGTTPRSVAAGLLIREEAEDLLARVSCSILAVKPADFATPVRLTDA